MGLDPQGYGNPDFCWLSLRDTLIWSFAGPIGTVIAVSAQKPRFSGAWAAGRPSRELSGVDGSPAALATWLGLEGPAFW